MAKRKGRNGAHVDRASVNPPGLRKRELEIMKRLTDDPDWKFDNLSETEQRVYDEFKQTTAYLDAADEYAATTKKSTAHDTNPTLENGGPLLSYSPSGLDMGTKMAEEDVSKLTVINSEESPPSSTPANAAPHSHSPSGSDMSTQIEEEDTCKLLATDKDDGNDDGNDTSFTFVDDAPLLPPTWKEC